MFIAGQSAIRLAPSWAMPANMLSNLDPNASFAGMGGRELIEPLNPGILTQPVWDSIFLTPNATIPTREIVEVPTSIPVQPTQPPREVNTPISKPSPTATIGGPIILPTKASRFADLGIDKSDNSNTYTPGTTVLYTIVVTNAGPDDASGFNIADTIPSRITGLTVTCSPSSNCGVNSSSGNNILFEGASLHVNNQFNITVSGQVPSGATGNLSNTATIHIPSVTLIEDLNGSNNSSTDTDTRLAISDLAITKSDGSNTYAANNPITYTIVVTNSGPSDALGVRVVDNIPPQVASWNWACTTQVNASGCNGATGSTSNFTDTGLNIKVGGRIEYTVTAYLPATAYSDTSSISNSASILLPGSPNFIDPNLSNNTSVDTDIPYIDLQITKADGGTPYAPGGTVTYTVTVTNNSTFDLTGITISDPKPSQITDWDWCAGTPCPPNFINTDFTDTFDLTAGSSRVYTVTANISGTAGTGNITNTASVSAPAGLVDADPTNNSATVVTSPYIDLQITKDDGLTSYTPGGSVIYMLIVTNNSAIDLTGVTVTDNMPTLLTSWSWTCAPAPGSPGASCTTGPNSMDINDTAVVLPAGESVIYTIATTVHPNAIGDLINTASVNPPAGFTDADTSNDTATDTDVNIIGEPEVGSPDTYTYDIPDNATATFFMSQPIIANGDGAADFVFYESPMAPGIHIDQVIIEISSDGSTWFPVFYWGDNIPDTNSDANYLTIANCPTSEDDNCQIPDVDLYPYPGWGIAIDVDNSPLGGIPAGNYPWIQFTEPGLGSTDGAHVDAIEILP